MRPERWLFTIPLRLRSLFRRAQADQELDDELRDHLERKTEEYVARGMAPEEARRRARLDLGGIEQTKEKCRDARRVNWIQDFGQDLRYGLRMLRKSLGFTTIAVLTLALGIGANTAMFSVVNTVLMRPLVYKSPDSIVRIWENDTHGNLGPYFSVSVPNFLDWRQQNRVFENMGAFASVPMTLTGGASPEQIHGTYVTVSLIDLLGVNPTIGRPLLPGEDQPGKDHEAILSYALWQERFGGDRAAIGKFLTLDGNIYTVVGVMPIDFDFPPNNETQVWIPMAFTPGMLQQRSAHIVSVVARLKTGRTLTNASAEMQTIARRLEQEHPDSNYGWTVTILPIHDVVVRDVRPALLLLLTAVGLVLLIACANITNLLLARIAARGKEIAVRTALGASPARLARQLLTESVLLAAIGGAFGLLVALLGVQGFSAMKPPDLPVIGKINSDWRVLTFASITSFACALFFGVTPLIQGARRDLTNTLKEGGRTLTGSVGTQKLRHALVVAEFSLASVLLVAAGLLVRSLLRLQNVNPGFDPRNILTAEISLPESNYRDPYQQAAFFDRLLQRVDHLPGVLSAGAFNAENVVDFAIEGRTPLERGKQITGRIRWATPNCFRTMGIPLIGGRVFTERDTDAAPKVIIINETMVRRYFGKEDPIGKRMTLGWGNPMWREIIGVVGDVKYSGLSENQGDEFYIPLAQTPLPWMTIVIRASGKPTALASSLRITVWSIDKDLPVSNLKTMEARLGESVAQPRFRTVLLGIFSGFALLLATIGIYGVVSYWVAQRHHEFGIRVALGAETRNLLGVVLWQSSKLIALGAGVGAVGALILTRLMTSLLYAVQPADPLTFLIVIVLLSVVALLASYIPARRASRVDPIVALHYE